MWHFFFMWYLFTTLNVKQMPIFRDLSDNSGILVPFVVHDGTTRSGGFVPYAFYPRPKA